MRCPVCNAKMQAKTVCPYCKIYADQVIYGSNIEAKKSLKRGLKDEVCVSKTRPYDVDKTKLLLITIFAGLIGLHNYYVGRKNRGIFYSICFGFAIFSSILFYLNQNYWISEVVQYILDIPMFLTAILVALWMCDIFAVAFGRFGIPIKLATMKEVKLREKKYE